MSKQPDLKAAYFSPPTKDDINVVDEIDNILQKNEFNDQALWNYRNSVDIILAKPKNEAAQRFLVREYFRKQLLMVDIPSAELRYMLLDESSTTDWLAMFEKEIVPVMKSNGLPILLRV